MTNDSAGRTALSHLLPLVKSSSQAPSSATAAKEAAKLFANKRYDALGLKMYSRTTSEDRVDSEILKLAYSDLDRGTLSVKCYKLSTMTSVLTADEEKVVELGGLSMTTKEKPDVVMARNGEVLL